MGALRRPQRAELTERVRQGSLGLGERRLQVDVALGRGRGERATLQLRVRFGARALVGEPCRSRATASCSETIRASRRRGP